MHKVKPKRWKHCLKQYFFENDILKSKEMVEGEDKVVGKTNDSK